MSHSLTHTQKNIEEASEKGPHTASVVYVGGAVWMWEHFQYKKKKNSFSPFQSTLKDFSNLILKGVELRVMWRWWWCSPVNQHTMPHPHSAPSRTLQTRKSFKNHFLLFLPLHCSWLSPLFFFPPFLLLLLPLCTHTCIFSSAVKTHK